ncbi:MAG: hypothetical protein F9K47_02030 [Burkholderiales bacterium]|nr:MAG: hypothetical protein F9K47_02030 [Burkholderiales bacterium]
MGILASVLARARMATGILGKSIDAMRSAIYAGLTSRQGNRVTSRSARHSPRSASGISMAVIFAANQAKAEMIEIAALRKSVKF